MRKFRLEDEKQKEYKNKKGMLVFIVVLLIFLAISFFIYMDAKKKIKESTKSTYNETKEQRKEEVYDLYYKTAYKHAEKNHHVKNDVMIDVHSLQEETKLEVLKVWDVEYIIPKEEEKGFFQSIGDKFKDDIKSWLEVPGEGIYTVNLRAGEFIIDQERNYVLIRIPAPRVTHCIIDYKNVKIINFEDSGIFKGMAGVGEEKAREQLKDAERLIEEEINMNDRFYNIAKENTKTVIKNIVKKLNPDIKDIEVEVQFMNE